MLLLADFKFVVSVFKSLSLELRKSEDVSFVSDLIEQKQIRSLQGAALLLKTSQYLEGKKKKIF